MKLSDYLVEELYSLTKTDKIFGYIGGMVAHVVDSIYQNSSVEMVNMITEQGAGFAAEGYARTTGKLGVAIATSGPGATNLVTPIANCYFDSTPVLFITGQVNTYEYQTYDIKQCGFQETNIVDIVKPITKYAKIITKAQDIKYELQKAVSIAMSGRKGPVLLDIPMNIQREEINLEELLEYDNKINVPNTVTFDTSLLREANRPLVLVGNGINLSDARDELMYFLKKSQIPVVQSLLGIDCISFDYEYNLGLIGTYGNRAANIALYYSDVLLVLGSRLDIRQTGGNADFMKNKKIIHVDIDKRELDCPKFNKLAINADIKAFLNYVNKFDFKPQNSVWNDKCKSLKNTFANDNKIYKTPNVILSQICNLAKEDDVIITDVGQNQVWTAQSVSPKTGQRIFSSAGHGCMGFALPAAIGSSFSDRKVFAICGDGGFQMNIQELEIIKRRNIPIKIVVMNNKNLGMVRTFQELYFDNRLASTVEDYSCPNFEKIANAYGINAITIDADDFDIEKVTALLSSNEPVLLNIEMKIQTQVEPRVQFGNSIQNGHPLLQDKFFDDLEKELFLNE